MTTRILIALAVAAMLASCYEPPVIIEDSSSEKENENKTVPIEDDITPVVDENPPIAEENEGPLDDLIPERNIVYDLGFQSFNYEVSLGQAVNTVLSENLPTICVKGLLGDTSYSGTASQLVMVKNSFTEHKLALHSQHPIASYYQTYTKGTDLLAQLIAPEAATVDHYYIYEKATLGRLSLRPYLDGAFHIETECNPYSHNANELYGDSFIQSMEIGLIQLTRLTVDYNTQETKALLAHHINIGSAGVIKENSLPPKEKHLLKNISITLSSRVMGAIKNEYEQRTMLDQVNDSCAPGFLISNDSHQACNNAISDYYKTSPTNIAPHNHSIISYETVRYDDIPSSNLSQWRNIAIRNNPLAFDDQVTLKQIYLQYQIQDIVNAGSTRATALKNLLEECRNRLMEPGACTASWENSELNPG